MFFEKKLKILILVFQVIVQQSKVRLGVVARLPQILKSMFFEIFSSLRKFWSPEVETRNFKKVDFSL